MANIPSITYAFPIELDRARRQHEYYEEEILMTRLLLMGHPAAGFATEAGIVSSTDPRTANAGDMSQPLNLNVNGANERTVDVAPGIFVTKTGVWARIRDTVTQISLSDPSVNVPNVIYARYRLSNAPPEDNYYADVGTPYTLRVGDPLDDTTIVNTQAILISSLTVDEWSSLSTSVTDDFVALGIATIQNVTEGAGPVGLQLVLDLTADTYSFNRPWFSPVDIAHREDIGTGAVTPGNPHGTGAADLTVGDLKLLQLFLDHGIIFAKDRSVAKVPGYICTEVHTNILNDDGSGTLPAGGATGYPGADYIELAKFPVRVGRVWATNSDETLAGVHVPGTNRIVFPYESAPTNDKISVWYTRVEACEPPTPGNNVFRTQGPANQELVVSGGVPLTQLSSVEENFSDAGRFPMRYEIFIDSEGAIRKTPQVVYCWKQLDTISGSDAFDIDVFGPGRLMVALAGPVVGSGFTMSLKVNGTTPDGAATDETFVFNDTNWSPFPIIPTNPLPGYVDSPGPIHVGSVEFGGLTNITDIVRTNGTSADAIMIWIAQGPYSKTQSDPITISPVEQTADPAHIATVDWNGYAFGNVFDRRIVTPSVPDYLEARAAAETERHLIQSLSSGNRHVWVEDFRRPRYDVMRSGSEQPEPTYALPSYNINKWRVGVHGTYETIAFPVATDHDPWTAPTPPAGRPAEGNLPHWRVTLLGLNRLTPDPAWFGDQHAPEFRYYLVGSGWTSYRTMVPVGPGSDVLPGTFEAQYFHGGTFYISRVQVRLRTVQATGMALYGGEWPTQSVMTP